MFVVRSVLVHIMDKANGYKRIFQGIEVSGRVSLFEPVVSKNTKICELIRAENFSNYTILRRQKTKSPQIKMILL